MMLSNTEIRAAREGDFAAIAAVYEPHVLTGTATFELDPPDAAEMGRRWSRIAAAGWPYLVAVRGGRLVGYAYAAQFKDRAGYRRSAETSIYLRVDCLRQGVGRLLLGALIERCAECGFRQLVAVIGDSDNAASIGLHRALGFVDAGLLRDIGEKFGRLIDVVYLQRGIGTEAAEPPL